MTEPNRQRWALFSLALLVVIALIPAPSGAVSATANGTPKAAQVGQHASARFTLTDLYTGAPTVWRLNATTGLDNATWTVTAYSLDHSRLATRSFHGDTLTTPIRASQNVSRVVVAVNGTTPSIANFTYRPQERFPLATFSQVSNGSRTVIRTWHTPQYTSASRSARHTLNKTESALADNGSTDALDRRFGFAVTAYGDGDFSLATDIAADVRDSADQSHYPVGLFSGLFIGAIVTALAAAGLRSYRDRSGDDDPWRDR